MTQPADASTNLVPLYQHTKGAEWGLGMLAWEQGPRRGYQFEDGKLRVFRKGFYGMLHEIDEPADRAQEIIARLSLHLGTDDFDRVPTPPAAPTISLDQQIEIFRMQHPAGFAGDGWQGKRRGLEQKRRLKRHRVPAIGDATERLAEEGVAQMIDAGRADEVIAIAADVLAATDLVTAAQLAPLRDLSRMRSPAAAQALHDLLWGDAPHAVRFERFVATLALTSTRPPAWGLITALPALLGPREHLYVRPATIDRQARYMAPRLVLGSMPGPQSYARALDMVQRVADALSAAGLPPADLWDVHDFMVDTLAPKAAELLHS